MDFREVIERNKMITKVVILFYILIMFVVGILADILLFSNSQLSFTENFLLFATFKKIPIATIIIMSLTVIGILGIKIFGHKIMLSGINAREVKEFGEGASNSEDKLKETRLFNIIQELALSANLGYTPKLYILETDEMNAFAAGWDSRNALVGITRGLLNNLNREEVKAVMAHEIGHIINGDSRLTLYVGILANVILTVTNIFSNIYFIIFRSSDNQAARTASLLIILMNLILPLITQVLYLFLSRKREYMADATAVKLMGYSDPMVNALLKISGHYESGENEDKLTKSAGESYRSAAYIYKSGDSIFSTHPSIENRIKELKNIS